ncbi:MAG: hypothetical protein MUF18_13115 [Fimbriiglobus sp.]|jgi:hypothetical protein|nr:hypothetical protein [Fimbriiglobus sp.]
MRGLGLLLAIGSVAALWAVGVAAPPPPPLHALAGPAAIPVEATPDPFPLRRQFLTDDQFDRLTADPRGPLRKLTRTDFDAKVRAAADASQLARTPPQLVTAAYRARYQPGQLTGSAEWTVANTAGRPGLVPLDALRLAVTDAAPTADRTALLFRGKPGGKELPGTFLWVGGERETAVTLGWSARGVEENDEERFDLGFPPAAIARLEITLPADRLPTLTTAGGKRVEATGPFPAAEGQTWRWAVGGLPGAVLAVRAADTPGSAVAASRTAGFELTPGEARGTFDFLLECPRGAIREQTFATDAGVRVTAVGSDGVERWRQEPADGRTAGKLTVAWREWVSTTRVRVNTTTELPSGAVEWRCPGVRTTNTLPGADTIEVVLSPEFKLDGWTANEYRPAVNMTGKSLKLQFAGSLAQPDGTRRPPAVRIRSAEPEIATDESLTWHVGPGRTRLTATVRVKVVRGPLPQFAVRTAPGYVLESVAVVPEDAAVNFGPLPGIPNAWAVEPSRAIPTGRSVEVKLEFRGPSGPPAPDAADPSPAAVAIPFPIFAPLNAVERQGMLTTLGEGVTAAARTVLPVAVDLGGWVVRYRGREPDGFGLFTPEPTAVNTDAVKLAVRNRVCEATVSGRADDGPVGSLTVFVPHPEGWVKGPEATTAVPLSAVHLAPLFTAPNGWSALAAAGTIPHGIFWRVTFPKPTTGPFQLTATYPAPTVDPTAGLTLPLPHMGGGRGDCVVELSPELSIAYRATPPTADFPPRVTLEPLAARPAVLPASGEWALTDVQQLNQIDGDGGLAVTLTGRVTRAIGQGLPVRLPPLAEMESAQVGGKWVILKPGGELSLPLPELPPDGITFEVRYHLPVSSSGPLPRYISPEPVLPVNVDITSRWQFAKGWLPWPGLSDADDCRGRTEVRVARSPVLRGVGFGLGGLVLAFGVWLIAYGRAWQKATLVLVVAGCGVGAWAGTLGWLKVLHPPLFVGLGVLATLALRRPSAGRPGFLKQPAGLLLAIGLMAQAQPIAEPAVVYIVGADAQVVYAPTAVLDKLDTLATPPLPEVVITRATYAAVAENAVVRFDATFTLECPRNGEHPFTLPLAGVRLETMQLDGNDAFPDAAKPERYTITVKGRGRHTLTARFAVVPTAIGGDREARFGGPEVHACTVTLDVGPKGRQPDIPTRRGAQNTSEANGRQITTADHGAGRAVAVRWREADGGAKTTLSVKEAGVWDATDSPEAGVWGAFAYRVESGGVDRFDIDIPAGLIPTRVLVRPTDPRANAVGLRGWRTTPGPDAGTRVTARLQQPTDGRVLVLVRAVPAKPLGPNPVLRFPQAADLPDADRDGVYAVRFPGVTSTNMTVGGAIDFPADAIVKDFPPVPEFAFDKLPPARVVRRAPNAAAELRPTLAPAAAFAPVSAEVAFTCGPRAEVEGVLRALPKDSGLVEFSIPDGIEVRDVRATGLGGWGRSGTRLQIWFRQPPTEAVIRWGGAVASATELPLPRWPGGAGSTEPTIVRVRAADGYSVQPTSTAGLKAKLGDEGEYVFTAEGSPPPLKVELRTVEPAVVKPTDPPAVKPVPPLAPAGSPVATPPADAPTAGFNPWPVVWAVVWGLGFLAAAVGLRSERWQPERLAAIGVFGMLMAGIGTPLGWVFGVLAAVGVAWRSVRFARRWA